MLALRLAGETAADAPTCAAAADDFGHIVHRVPACVVRPASSADVASVVSFAARNRIPVSARGSGHSTNGQSQADSGIVLDMTALRQIHELSRAHVIVDAGISWRSLLTATLPSGMAPPVLTDYLGLSVGGTLSVGGIGGTSHRHGPQTANVLELEVVTGDGGTHTCSASRNPGLFHAVLAGLGQCGVITRATLRLVPAAERVRRYKLYYEDLHALTAEQRSLLDEGRFDFLQGQVQPDDAGGWRHMLEVATFFSPPAEPRDDDLPRDLGYARGFAEIEDLTYFEFLDRLTVGEEYLRATGEWMWPHPWWNVLLPNSEVDAFVESAMAGTTRDDIGENGVVLVYPFPRDRFTTPLLRVPAEPLVFLFTLLRFASPADPTAVERMTRSNRELHERARSVGGCRYPVGTVPFGPDDWRAHFGATWDDLVRAKSEYDPQRILAPGQGIF
ncbi:hypothetical protein GCM10012275_26860 [Longimycelium tulufanense]|uniref:FAD-binding PCMH-type domain-containing protein n=1 Tax=Longimycelium tulufanense TaxID=907463 RepID=A0A8J3CCP7_9PSEU|nr:FAD-binding protein [Longimycelium tulufanense]GGM54348.1 hypothetical protein GCM10012275_26860 [Longimycelium tulufanense]